MTSLLFLLSSMAFADTPIGTEKKFGIGAELGYGSYINFSGKGWFNDKYGLSFRVGTSFFYHEAAVRFEGVIYRGQWFDWADLPFFWHVGMDIGLWTYGGYHGVQFGPEVGGGAALQFSEFSGEVFMQHAIGIYPIGHCNNGYAYAGRYLSASCHVDYRGTIGFRYYF